MGFLGEHMIEAEIAAYSQQHMPATRALLGRVSRVYI